MVQMQSGGGSYIRNCQSNNIDDCIYIANDLSELTNFSVFVTLDYNFKCVQIAC